MSALAILYVDDDADIRTVATMALRLDAGLTVHAVDSGPAALALLDSGDVRPDIILLDVMMPGMGGVALLDAIRTRAALAAVPILFMTARARIADVDAYRAAGAAGVIAKPFDPLRLAGEVRAAAGR